MTARCRPFRFACAVAKEATVAPATDRQDVAAWLGAPSIASFHGLLRGRQAENGVACLNEWGLSVDDAKVLPVLKVLLSTTDAEDEGLLELRDYVAFSFELAGIQA